MRNKNSKGKTAGNIFLAGETLEELSVSTWNEHHKAVLDADFELSNFRHHCKMDGDMQLSTLRRCADVFDREVVILMLPKGFLEKQVETEKWKSYRRLCLSDLYIALGHFLKPDIYRSLGFLREIVIQLGNMRQEEFKNLINTYIRREHG